MEGVIKLPKAKAVQFFVADIAKGLFNGMIGNYLLYIYQPTAKSGLPNLLPDNKLLGFITIMALLTIVGKLVDAITDPLVAKMSDKCSSKYGRRMPFLRVAAVPYALSVLLVFLAPFENGSVGNAVWVGITLCVYYLFYTIYFIPHRALVPEIIPDRRERVSVYAMSTVFFMGSSAIMYATTLFVSWFKAAGLDALTAWRLVFLIFSIVGVTCLLISAFAFNEKKYVKGSSLPQESLLKSFKIVLKNKQFVIFSLGDLFNYIAMAFFQNAMLYYITVLINVKEEQSFIIMAAAIATAIILFPFIVKVSKKYNKKTPLLVGCWMFAVLFAAIYFGDRIAALMPGYELVLGVLMGIAVAYPFATINIIPQAVISDIIQADSLKSGVNREGFYSACKTFLEKIAAAVATGIVSSVLAIGAIAGESVGLSGIKYTGLFACVFCLLSAICFTLYKDKSITSQIDEGLLKGKREKIAKNLENGISVVLVGDNGRPISASELTVSTTNQTDVSTAAEISDNGNNQAL